MMVPVSWPLGRWGAVRERGAGRARVGVVVAGPFVEDGADTASPPILSQVRKNQSRMMQNEIARYRIFKVRRALQLLSTPARKPVVLEKERERRWGCLPMIGRAHTQTKPYEAGT